MSKSNSKVIVITSGKGGVGKTTTTANLGVGLSLLGNKVVLIDTDIGLRNLDVVLGLESRIVYDIVDVVTGVCKPRQAIIKDKRFEGLFVLPAAQTKDKDAIQPEQMKLLCKELKKEFDYVIIDCPAGIEQGFKNAVAGADKAIVVTTPEISAIRDADRIAGLLEVNEVSEYSLLINRLRPNMIKRGDMMNIDEIMEIIGINLIGVVLEDEEIIASSNKGEPVVINKKSKAGQGYRNIAKRLNGENVSIMNLENDGFFFRIKKVFSKK